MHAPVFYRLRTAGELHSSAAGIDHVCTHQICPRGHGRTFSILTGSGGGLLMESNSLKNLKGGLSYVFIMIGFRVIIKGYSYYEI